MVDMYKLREKECGTVSEHYLPVVRRLAPAMVMRET